MQATSRLPLVGVMGSSDAHLEKLRAENPTGPDRILERAHRLGTLLAKHPVNLLTGGGGGAMRAVCRGFASRPTRVGKLVGVIPGPLPRAGYPNEFIEIVIRTHLPGKDPLAETSRNHINVLSSDLVIALPGGPGTSAEVELSRRYERPVTVLLGHGDRIGERTGDAWAGEGIPWFTELDQVSDWLASRLSCQADVQDG